MKKLLTLIFFLFFSFSVNSAETHGSGTVNEVNIIAGYIVINNVKYAITHGQTQFISGNKHIDLAHLKRGLKIDYIVSEGKIKQINVKTSLIKG